MDTGPLFFSATLSSKPQPPCDPQGIDWTCFTWKMKHQKVKYPQDGPGWSNMLHNTIELLKIKLSLATLAANRRFVRAILPCIQSTFISNKKNNKIISYKVNSLFGEVIHTDLYWRIWISEVISLFLNAMAYKHP